MARNVKCRISLNLQVKRIVNGDGTKVRSVNGTIRDLRRLPGLDCVMVKMNGIPAHDVRHSHAVEFHAAEASLGPSDDYGVAAESGQEGVGTRHLRPSALGRVAVEGKSSVGSDRSLPRTTIERVSKPTSHWYSLFPA